MNNKFKIGIDIGGTKIEALLLDENDKIFIRKRISTPKIEGYDAILKSVCEFIVETQNLIPSGKEYTIGIGIPGMIESESQLVHNANTTCLIGKPFKQDIESVISRKIGMENDANCFTLAETIAGAAKGYNLVFGVIMGTGCGGGICINGKVWSGIHGIAGEWGHFSIDPNGNKCYCGQNGCIETKISGSGVEESFFIKYKKKLKMEEILKGSRNNDKECTLIFDQFLDDFGRALGGLISILDPEVVVIGGGLSNIDELYTSGIKKVKKYAFHRDIKTPILKNTLGDSAGVFGAAWIGI
ncbi:MAG: ROK family protein [Desulfobacterales bacterium]|nr:ROK family protein [Desulfobacterales bacterium]